MIIGLGSDIVDVRRIAKVIERHGDRFLDRIFTSTERARAENRANAVETYAKRFERLRSITPAGCEARIDISLTDEGPTAQAIVIISAEPMPGKVPENLR